jgi:RNA polymerase sigma factor (sigma-70 family)
LRARIEKSRLRELANNFRNLTRREESDLYYSLDKQLRFYIHRFTKDDNLKDDIMGRIWERWVLNQDKFDGDKGALSTYLHRIAHNVAIEHMFHYTKKIKTHLSTDPSYSEPDGRKQIVQLVSDDDGIITSTKVDKMDFLVGLVLEEIPNLKEKEAIIITRMYIDGVKQKDLVEELGINLNTIKTMARKAKSDLSFLLRRKHPHLVDLLEEIF